MKMQEELRGVIEVLKELKEDATVPRNVKERIATTIKALEEKSEVSIRVNKALHELEVVADDPNLEAYTRTQIWNIVSALEKIA